MTITTDSWYSELTNDQREIAFQLRQFINEQQPQLREEIKWSQPCFYGSSMVCYIQRAKGHMALGFGQGARLTDIGEMLEGSGNQMRHMKFPLGKSLDKNALKPLLDQAVALDSVV